MINFLKNKNLIVLLIILNLLFLTSCVNQVFDNSSKNINDNNKLSITMLDVGQADCILISSNNEHMLIDAGNNDDANTILNYLKANNINKFKYVIGTHPHEDHIGSLDKVINEFDIETVIMPNAIANTKSFEDVITAIENKNLDITAPNVGDTYKLGNAKFIIIAPNRDYDDLNNMSVGIKLSYGENSFIFCGDAEVLSESDILKNNININADILKVSHHGSNTSTSEEFLKAVNPKYAVISVGKDNSYGHPHKEILKKLSEANIELYRTDLQGNIIISSDGKNIKINVEALNNTNQADNDENKVKNIEYALNSNTKKFHYTTCKSLKQMEESNKMYFKGNRNEIIKQGYEPCKICNP